MIPDTVYAVKCYRGSLFGLDDENFSAFLTFLKYNACLTHLQLGFQHSSVSCVRILDALLDSKVLETVVLTGYPIAYKDGINKADSLVDFLNNVKTLTKLSLKSCSVEGDTGMYTRQNKKRNGVINKFFIKLIRIYKISLIPSQRYTFRPCITYIFKGTKICASKTGHQPGGGQMLKSHKN